MSCGVKVGLNDPPQNYGSALLRSNRQVKSRSCPLTAAREGRTMAQICEAFLKARSEAYMKEGPKYLQRFLSRQKREDLSN